MPEDIRIEDIPLAQGPAKPATAEDLVRDAVGITYPNLHRRIDTDLSATISEFYLTTEDGYRLTTEDGFQLLGTSYEPAPGSESYILSVAGVSSFRTTERKIHDEDSTTSEIP